MPAAGPLRHVLLYQEPAPAFDRNHQPLPSWSTVATLRGEVRTPTGREALAAQGLATPATLTHVVVTRHAGFAPKPAGRLLWQTAPSGSTGVLAVAWAGDPDGRRRETHYWCLERTDTADTSASSV